MRAAGKSWPSRQKRGATIVECHGIPVVRLSEANIWDYGDLVRLREAIVAIRTAGGRRFGVDLAHVVLLPSGFMNMLCEWEEKGFDVYLFSPRQNVRDMLWFNRFTEQAFEDAWRLTCTRPRGPWLSGEPETSELLDPRTDAQSGRNPTNPDLNGTR